MSGGQGTEASEQVADCMSAKGQNGGDCEDDETTISWTCEGRCKRVEKSPRLLGQLLMIPVEDASSLAGLQRLLVPEDVGVVPWTSADGADRLEWPWQPPF